MGVYRLLVVRSAEREISRLPLGLRRRVVARIQGLAGDPRPPGSQKLTGDDKHRVRQGDHRVVYTIDDRARAVTVVRVAHRSDVYR